MKINNVVQFNENHKWCGCLGIIYEIREYENDVKRIMVGIPIPEQGTAHIFCGEDDLELIGNAILVGQGWE